MSAHCLGRGAEHRAEHTSNCDVDATVALTSGVRAGKWDDLSRVPRGEGAHSQTGQLRSAGEGGCWAPAPKSTRPPPAGEAPHPQASEGSQPAVAYTPPETRSIRRRFSSNGKVGGLSGARPEGGEDRPAFRGDSSVIPAPSLRSSGVRKTSRGRGGRSASRDYRCRGSSRAQVQGGVWLRPRPLRRAHGHGRHAVHGLHIQPVRHQRGQVSRPPPLPALPAGSWPWRRPVGAAPPRRPLRSPQVHWPWPCPCAHNPRAAAAGSCCSSAPRGCCRRR